VISRQGGGKTRSIPNGSADCKDRRGDAAGAAPGCPFDSIDTISFKQHDEEGVVHPLDYGIEK
jgi:hypothetical protein